jgi:hypothetical protein
VRELGCHLLLEFRTVPLVCTPAKTTPKPPALTATFVYSQQPCLGIYFRAGASPNDRNRYVFDTFLLQREHMPFVTSNLTAAGFARL